VHEGVRLMWPGRRWRMGDAHSEGNAPQSSPRTAPRVFDITPGTHPVRILHGDVLDLTRTLTVEGLSGTVDLVYVDPPYASDRDYVAESRLDGPADGRVVRSPAYEDTWTSKAGGLGAYLEMLAPRLEALVDLLSPKGTVWVHLDWRAAYLVRAILDEVLGREQFLNEIVWRRAPNLGRQATSGQFGRTLDTLVVYGRPGAKLTPPTRLEPIEESAIRTDEEGRPFTSAPRGDYTDASIAKLDLEGRVHRTATGRVYIKYFLVKNADGVWCRERRVDALWTDVPPLRHAASSERTGYPTQKPRALLERIIACATPPGGLVVDAFGGSGTTAVAAHALGRRAVIADRSAVAIATARARLLREGAGVTIERAADAVEPAGAAVEVAVTPTTNRQLLLGAPAESVTITLARSAEPMAWAIGTMKNDAFHCAWHAERVLGSKAAAAERTAVVARRDASSVRVWADDGSITTASIPSPSIPVENA
jgi:DNA modification methylase